LRNAARVLDGEVGYAAAGVELVRRREGLRRAGVLTGLARTAAIGVRGIGCDLHRGVDRCEEQPASVLAADEVGVLPLPADPRRLTERLFHHRRGIDEDLEL